ncbi:hypothetical protein FOS14_01050 [Skermania sp. ID1734]|uniref:transglycosylase SLT domain-containing protein n=1 Tax=Skermania sp. ID1734 TaxID=2597516 RepID=UPI00117E5A92|nr:transglycosylase SLT domain-containing protein [Skermania sp. ID1734]TSE02007.1 hypothetical protein FOS14_01050 [Skermania sp. ID1734]
MSASALSLLGASMRMSARTAAGTAGAAVLGVVAVSTMAPTSHAASENVAPMAVVQHVAPAPAPAPVPAVAPAPAPLPAPVPPPAPVYPDNLDGWIRQALDILHAHNIPASYDGIMRNVMRESTGNPQAINLYDSNAAAGIPSKGLLQVIDPTFAAFHIDGTSWNIYDPVANIVAACNYAASMYGSIDNVDSAY